MVRKSGILLPLTSLPSKYGIGDMGPEATKFAEFLKEAGQSVWQVLPLGPVDGGSGNSPYSPTSAFAGNPLLISPEALVSSGLLDEDDLKGVPTVTQGPIHYDRVRVCKEGLLQRAWANFKNSGAKTDFDCFFDANRYWLEPYSFFAAIKEERGGQPWYDWPEPLKFRHHEALHHAWLTLQDKIEYHRFVQFVFASQMADFRECLEQFEIELVGDMPIYMTRDCADVWVHPHLFELDETLTPLSVAGVPPDYFSATGQLWGNPLYRWDAMASDGFQWWISRLRHLLTSFDKIRIDHFRGLIGYWSVAADADTAEKGCWRNVPHEHFFARLCQEFPQMPFWAENLGILTPGIETARRGMRIPGMLVLHFAFGNPAENPYAPHNHTRDNVVYTGTHDNNTTLGWFLKDASAREISNLILYLGHEVNQDSIAGDMVRMAMASVADIAVVPMQDHLELDERGRINIPSTPSGNWTWRMSSNQATKELASRIRALTELYGRLPPVPQKA
ncbi:MAG: 4-alpha-glucanotransferase [Fretibacterium sp.]|mgnify:CR=1 FL=1|nr:4-alpha-glucanotransferase [Fretibacterium sp.]